MTDAEGPFWGPPPAEVAIPHAPLVRVVCQLTFDEILSIADRNYISGFQERIRKTYRIFKPEEHVVLGALLGSEVHKATTWRFYDADEIWRVTLATNFVALETLVYSSRVDFIDRISKIAEAACELFQIEGFTRIGVRYVDQITGDNLINIRDIVRRPFLGVLSEGGFNDIDHVFSQLQSKVAEGEAIVKWGMLPENRTYDLNVFAPIPEASWFFDFDVYRTADHHGALIGREDAREVAYSLATRAYTIFKWATTERFAVAYGA